MLLRRNWRLTAEELSANTSSDAVVNADKVFIDNVALRKGWSGGSIGTI